VLLVRIFGLIVLWSAWCGHRDAHWLASDLETLHLLQCLLFVPALYETHKSVALRAPCLLVSYDLGASGARELSEGLKESIIINVGRKVTNVHAIAASAVASAAAMMQAEGRPIYLERALRVVFVEKGAESALSFVAFGEFDEAKLGDAAGAVAHDMHALNGA